MYCARVRPTQTFTANIEATRPGSAGGDGLQGSRLVRIKARQHLSSPRALISQSASLSDDAISSRVGGKARKRLSSWLSPVFGTRRPEATSGRRPAPSLVQGRAMLELKSELELELSAGPSSDMATDRPVSLHRLVPHTLYRIHRMTPSAVVGHWCQLRRMVSREPTDTVPTTTAAAATAARPRIARTHAAPPRHASIITTPFDGVRALTPCPHERS